MVPSAFFCACSELMFEVVVRSSTSTNWSNMRVTLATSAPCPRKPKPLYCGKRAVCDTIWRE